MSKNTPLNNLLGNISLSNSFARWRFNQKLKNLSINIVALYLNFPIVPEEIKKIHDINSLIDDHKSKLTSTFSDQSGEKLKRFYIQMAFCDVYRLKCGISLSDTERKEITYFFEEGLFYDVKELEKNPILNELISDEDNRKYAINKLDWFFKKMGDSFDKSFGELRQEEIKQIQYNIQHFNTYSGILKRVYVFWSIMIIIVYISTLCTIFGTNILNVCDWWLNL